MSKGRGWLDQSGLSSAPLGWGSSRVPSGAPPPTQKGSDRVHAQDALLFVAITFCWQFCWFIIIWFFKGTTPHWDVHSVLSKIFIFIEIVSFYSVSQLPTAYQTVARKWCRLYLNNIWILFTEWIMSLVTRWFLTPTTDLVLISACGLPPEWTPSVLQRTEKQMAQVSFFPLQRFN